MIGWIFFGIVLCILLGIICFGAGVKVTTRTLYNELNKYTDEEIFQWAKRFITYYAKQKVK